MMIRAISNPAEELILKTSGMGFSECVREHAIADELARVVNSSHSGKGNIHCNM